MVRLDSSLPDFRTLIDLRVAQPNNMGERAKKSDAESAIARNSRVLEGAQEDLAGLNPKVIDNNDFTPFAEDFLDPQHPLYGTMDEHGRRIPGWLEQITVRYQPLQVSCFHLAIYFSEAKTPASLICKAI